MSKLEWHAADVWIPGDDEVVYLLMEVRDGTAPSTPIVVEASFKEDAWYWGSSKNQIFSWRPVGWRYISPVGWRYINL